MLIISATTRFDGLVTLSFDDGAEAVVSANLSEVKLIDAARQTALTSWIAAGGIPDPYVPGPPPVPTSITRTQGLLALLDRDPVIAEADIQAVIDAIPDPIERTRADLRFRAATWERASPWVAQLGFGLGLTETEIDDLFREAATL